MKNWKNITLLTLGILLLVISFQNLDPLPFRLLFWKVGIRPVILLPLMLLTGFIAGRLTRRKRS